MARKKKPISKLRVGVTLQPDNLSGGTSSKQTFFQSGENSRNYLEMNKFEALSRTNTKKAQLRNRGYYNAVRRYEISLRVLTNNSLVSAEFHFYSPNVEQWRYFYVTIATMIFLPVKVT